ncbi:MAG: M48 family metallopeptidase [Gammaproteobacteria bacterium]|nr:M48 family metallopeptidase [Gammaproteobacteria bacterium]
MDFFSQQEKAKRYTKVLLLYFFLAISFIVIAVNVVIYYFFMFLEFYPYTPADWFSGSAVYYISGATCLLILSGSVYRWLKLKSGGHAVAAMVGAKKLDLHTSDNKKRQLIHVVEEMSIASGVPIPGLYVMEDESAINAFVAGYLPTEAVMVVTEGAINNFTRNEMQSVIAHEYSHILNGDMQINIRLMSMLAGILMISSLGHLLIRAESRSYSSKKSGGLMALGFLFLLVGYIGVFFGRLIKAAVSRQREYLADAASVQYTRNPDGMTSALNKIREANVGSYMKSAYAEDMSHMCFAQTFNMLVTSWMATHPPLLDRIKRIDPTYVARIKARDLNKKYNKKTDNDTDITTASGGISASENSVLGSVMNFSEVINPEAVTSSELLDTAGNIDEPHIEFAVEIHNSFSDDLMQSIHLLETAKMIVLNLILVRMNFDEGIKFLRRYVNENELGVIDRFNKEITVLENFQRLPLFELLLPTLKQMEDAEKTDFLILCEKLIKSDKRYTLFEFVLLSMLKKNLSPDSGKDIKIKYYSYKSVDKELQLIFSVMAHSSQSEESMRIQSYNKVSQGFSMNAAGGNLKLLDFKDITPAKLTIAFQRLSQLSPILKRNVLESSADIAMHDGQLKYAEAELLRAIGDLLNCPLPPLLPQAVN